MTYCRFQKEKHSWYNGFFVAIASLGSEKAAFPAPFVRDLVKDWIRAPTVTNNGNYERRGEGRPNANIHFVRLGKPALTTKNFHPNVRIRSADHGLLKSSDFDQLLPRSAVWAPSWRLRCSSNKWDTLWCQQAEGRRFLETGITETCQMHLLRDITQSWERYGVQ